MGIRMEEACPKWDKKNSASKKIILVIPQVSIGLLPKINEKKRSRVLGALKIFKIRPIKI